jgi:hypothetical protein
MSERGGRARLLRIVAGFLAISYGLGAPLAAMLELRNHTFSLRFGLPQGLVYLTFAVQFVCALGVLVRPLASWAAATLTLTTLGAIALHVKTGSPLTALPAAVYTAVQVWFGLARRAWRDRQ